MSTQQFAQVSTGGCHTLAIDESRSLWAWGSQEYGQCGDPIESPPNNGSSNSESGTAEDAVLLPRIVRFDQRVRSVACGWSHSALITEAGQVFTWGLGKHSQLGHWDAESVKAPRLVQALEHMQVRSVSCGWKHTAATLESGCLYTWGSNSHGQLGTGDKTTRTIPTLIPLHLAVETSESSSVNQAQVVAQAVEERKGLNAHSVSCGWQFTVVVSGEGFVYSFGSNKFGQLGRQGTELLPARVLLPPADSSEGAFVSQIDTGWSHVVALTKDGLVYGWGRGNLGQIGSGEKNHQSSPCLIHALSDKRVKQVACGSEHSMAVTDAGELYSWGWNEHANLCLGDKITRFTPCRVPLAGYPNCRVSHVWTGGAAVFVQLQQLSVCDTYAPL